MDWTKENCLRLVTYFREKRELWDSSSVDFKDRRKRNEAWQDLADKLNVERTEAERKMLNLVLNYKRNVKKYFEELTSEERRKFKAPNEAGIPELSQINNQPAFGQPSSSQSPANSFQDLYQMAVNDCKVVYGKPRIVEESEQSGSSHGVGSHFAKNRESTDDRLLEGSRASSSRKRVESNTDPLSDSIKRQRLEQNLTVASKHTEEDLSQNEDRPQAAASAAVECDLYGQFLAQKLKPLDVEDRLVLINDIDNLVFKHLMNIRKQSKFSRSAELQPPIQEDTDNRQSIDLSGCSSRSDQIQNDSENVRQNTQSEVSEIKKKDTS